MKDTQPDNSSWTGLGTDEIGSESEHFDLKALARRLFDQRPSIQQSCKSRKMSGSSRPLDRPLPNSIAGYRVKEHIGRGAFGNVYLCQEQEPPNRELAIKVIRAGMDTTDVLARFEAEKNALSMMNHSAIARILDAGATEDGNPYFAMEYVDGVPLTEYCARKRLTLEERLRLFIEICQGVQHAHNKAVVHRDLKPSNIMVTTVDGVTHAKIIDFGLVKSLQQPLGDRSIHTRYGVALGTYEYMSPEQVKSGGSHLDTRSDIYALGAILYELLTGELAFPALRECSYREIARVITGSDAVLPSLRLESGDEDRLEKHADALQTELDSLKRCLATDLDWIVMKAMEKEPDRRYQASQELANDIERYLNGELVEARPPSATYRLKKTVSQYREALMVTSLLFLSLLVGMSWALTERNNAQMAAKERTAGSDFLMALYSDFDPDAMAVTLRNNFITQGREAGQREGLSGDALEDYLSEVEQSISRVNWASLGESVLSSGFLKALTKEIEFGDEQLPLTRASLLQIKAEILRDGNHLDNAKKFQEEALAIRMEELGRDHRDTLYSVYCTGLLQNALTYGMQGDQRREQLEAARLTLQQAHEDQKRVLGAGDPDTLKSHFALGLLLYRLNETQTAIATLYEVIELRKKTLGESDPQTQRAMFILGYNLSSKGHLAEAHALLQQVLQHRQRMLPLDHPDLLDAKLSMGKLLMNMDKPHQGKPLVEQAVAGFRRAYTREHPKTFAALATWANLLHDLGSTDDALRLYKESLEGFRRLHGNDHPATLSAINLLGSMLMEVNRFAEALPLLEEALASRRRVFSDQHIQVSVSCHNLGRCYRYMGDLHTAEKLGAEAVSIATVLNNQSSKAMAYIYESYSRTLVGLERFEEAKRFAQKAWDVIEPWKCCPESRRRSVLEGHVALYLAWDEAEPDAGRDQVAALWQEKLDAAIAEIEAASIQP